MIIRTFIYAAPFYVLLDREAGGVITVISTVQVRTFQAHSSCLSHSKPQSGPGTEAVSKPT